MFNTVFIEKDVLHNKYTQRILEKVKFKTQKEVENVDDIWGRVKKPYLQKRETLNLFIGNKKGAKVKEAPPAYGHGKEKHFYFIHAYNCIYECQYCYLQGYFNTPDVVLFVNHSEIIDEMREIVKEHPDAWFHAGEYSDSLALSHITNEFEEYFEFFKEHPKAKLELRTKSVNIKSLESLTALSNTYVSFTMSSHTGGKAFDFKCPSVKARLIAIEKLVKKGYSIGLHFDPIIYHEGFKEEYQEVIKSLEKILPDNQLGYISVGVVRFTKDVYREVEKNYPDSLITKQDYIKSFDNKIRYNGPMRMWMMNSIKDSLINHGKFSENKIYFCMEE
jgi:spore photoproduct lyase